MISRTSLLLALFVATPVAAAPRVDLDRCVAFDANELQRAIDRELPVDAGEHPYVVVVQCPDLVTAIMDVEPQPASGAIARTLDLGEVPTDLRLKLLALAAAEMVKVATTLSAPTSPPPMPIVTGPVHRPRPMPKPELEIHEPEAPSEPVSFAPSPRAGIRVFELTPKHPLATIGAELRLHPFRFGAEGSFGQATDEFGRIRVWMATLTAGYELCSGEQTTLCAIARVELGIAGTDVTPTQDTLVANNIVHSYTQVGPAFELAHHFDGWSFVAELGAGYAWGLIADTGVSGSGSHGEALAGLVGAAHLGARWP